MARFILPLSLEILRVALSDVTWLCREEGHLPTPDQSQLLVCSWLLGDIIMLTLGIILAPIIALCCYVVLADPLDMSFDLLRPQISFLSPEQHRSLCVREISLLSVCLILTHLKV